MSLLNYEHAECGGQMVWMNEPNSPLLKEKQQGLIYRIPKSVEDVICVFGIIVSNVSCFVVEQLLTNWFY